MKAMTSFLILLHHVMAIFAACDPDGFQLDIPTHISSDNPVRRNAYVCYTETNANMSNCSNVIKQVRALIPAQELYLDPKQCKRWTYGSCLGGVCAKGDIALIITAGAVAHILVNTLFPDCMRNGMDGAFLNCNYPDSACERYRVYLSEDPNAIGFAG